MTKVSVIMGFQYSGKRELPVIVLDMYQMYRFIKSPSIILTDMERDRTGKELSKSLKPDNSDAHIFSFLRDAQSAQQYHFWQSKEHIRKTIQEHVRGATCVFFYYTGHATQGGNLILPDGNPLAFSTLLRWMTDVVKPDAEMVLLLDCCHATSLNLPYQLIMDQRASRFRTTALQTGGIYHLNGGSPTLTTQHILVLCSAMEDEQSTISNTGSTFTHLLLHVLKEHRQVHEALVRVQEIMRNQQTCRAYASHPDFHAFPLWMFLDRFERAKVNKGGITLVRQPCAERPEQME